MHYYWVCIYIYTNAKTNTHTDRTDSLVYSRVVVKSIFLLSLSLGYLYKGTWKHAGVNATDFVNSICITWSQMDICQLCFVEEAVKNLAQNSKDMKPVCLFLLLLATQVKLIIG